MWFDGFAWVFCCCYSFFWNVSCGQELFPRIASLLSLCILDLKIIQKHKAQVSKVLLKITNGLMSGDI